MVEPTDHGTVLLERALARLAHRAPADQLQLEHLVPALVDALGEYAALTDAGHAWVHDLAGGGEPAGPPAPAAHAACVEVLTESITRMARSEHAPKRIADCIALAVPSLFVAHGPGLVWLGYEAATPPPMAAPSSPMKPSMPPAPSLEEIEPVAAADRAAPSAAAGDVRAAIETDRPAFADAPDFDPDRVLANDNPIGDLTHLISWEELPNPMMTITCHHTFAGVCAEFGQPYPHQTELDRLLEEARRHKTAPASASSGSAATRSGIGQGLR